MLDAFHIVKLAGDALDEVRRRVQQDTLGHRGRKGDPLYQIRNLLRASRDRLTKRQQERLRAAFTADEAHISVEVAYQPTGQVCDALHEDTPNTLLASIDTATNSVQSRYVKDCGALATPKSERSLGVSYTVTSESLYAIALPLPA